MTRPMSEILMFQVGSRVFAAEVQDVVRIGKVGHAPDQDVLGESPLGVPFEQWRGIVVAGDGGATERTLVVDQVLGVRSVPDADVHPLPAFAAACLPSAAVSGFIMIDEAPMLLVDLPTLVREGLAPRADAERT